MTQANTSFRSFPSTQPPPEIVPKVVEVFERHHEVIAPAAAGNRFGSDNVLSVLRDDLVTIGFDVELSKKQADKLQRPVFFGDEVSRRFTMKLMLTTRKHAAALRSRQGVVWRVAMRSIATSFKPWS